MAVQVTLREFSGLRRRRAADEEDCLGLTYVFEPMVVEQLRSGRLEVVFESYAATVPGFFLYFPNSARRSAPLRVFIEAARAAGLPAVK